MATDFLHDHTLHGGDRKNYFKGHKIISDQMNCERLAVVWDNLDAVLQAGTTGHIVEFGCYAGTTSLYIRRLLDTYEQSEVRQFHVYDSFAGLPEKSAPDRSAAGEDFTAGLLRASKRELLGQFHSAALQPPIIHKGWFSDVTPDTVPSPIAFGFLDGDFYGSIIDSLRLVWPRMTPGGIVLIDDYHNVRLPGVDRAINDYFRAKPVKIYEQHNIAVIRA